MDKLLKKICSLLAADDVELQCSAARVLKEVAPHSSKVRISLARQLATPNIVVRNYILSALARMPGPEILRYLFPLLKDGGKIQERASTLIASTGPSGVSEVKKIFHEADPELKKLLVRILGTIGTRNACLFLIDSINAADGELNRSISLALKEAIGRMPRKEKRVLMKKISSFLADAETERSVEKMASGVALLGYLAERSTIPKMLKYTGIAQPTAVREQALIALSHLDLAAQDAAEVAAVVLTMLDEDDYQNIVRHALAVIQKIDIPKRLVPALRDKLDSRHPAVRSFVIAHLGATGSDGDVERLLSHLNSADFQERRAAQDALAAMPKAYPEVIKELEAGKDYESGMRLVSILKAQRDRIGEHEKHHLCGRFEKLWATRDERGAVYAAALGAIDSNFFLGQILGRVRRLKGGNKFRDVVDLLHFLSRHAPVNDEIRYELAIALLRTNPPDLSPVRRKDDEGLKVIGELVSHGDFLLLKRLTREKALGLQDLYHIGFHFAESTLQQKEFGIQLLTRIMKKHGRSRAGISARQKLALVGAAGAAK